MLGTAATARVAWLKLSRFGYNPATAAVGLAEQYVTEMKYGRQVVSHITLVASGDA